MNSEPNLRPDWTQKPLDVWKRLGPLDLNELHQNNPIDLSSDLIYHDETEAHYSNYYGQKRGDRWYGIGRYVHTIDGEFKNKIEEGQFDGFLLNGFGRIILSDWAYYIGFFKDRFKHGKGKHVKADGTMLDGLWDNGDFLG